MQKNPQINRVFWGVGGGILLLTLALVLLLPGHGKLIAGVGAGAMLALYPAMLSRSFKPKQVPVSLYVDQSGICADNAPLVRREDITQAYIRPAYDKQVVRAGGYSAAMPFGFYRFFITLPAGPLTVEMMTRRGPGLSIDPGGEGPAAEILTALGFPVTTCPPGYRPRPRRSRWGLTAAIIVLFLAAFFGYYFFMVYKTTHH